MYDMECFDLNYDKFIKNYADIHNYIKTMNACDGRVQLKLLKTIDEETKQYLVKIKIKMPKLDDRYAFTVFNLGIDNGRSVFIHT